MSVGSNLSEVLGPLETSEGLKACVFNKGVDIRTRIVGTGFCDFREIVFGEGVVFFFHFVFEEVEPGFVVREVDVDSLLETSGG